MAVSYQDECINENTRDKRKSSRFSTKITENWIFTVETVKLQQNYFFFQSRNLAKSNFSAKTVKLLFFFYQNRQNRIFPPKQKISLKQKKI